MRAKVMYQLNNIVCYLYATAIYFCAYNIHKIQVLITA